MASSLDPSLLNTLSVLRSLSPLFGSSLFTNFANPQTLATVAQANLTLQQQFPSEQALALSGLLSQALAVGAAAEPLILSPAATTLLEQTRSPILPAAPFTQTAASSSDTAAVTATSLSGATLTSYAVGVNQVGVAQVNDGSVVASNTLNNVGLGITSGTIDISINGGAPTAVSLNVTGTFTNEDALTAVAQAISGANLGVTATVVNDPVAMTSQLQVSATQVGTANSFTLTNGTSNGVTAAGASAATTTAENTIYTVNGATYQLTSGTTATIDNGNLTLTFVGTTTTPATVTVTSNNTDLASQVTNLTDAFNNLQTFLTTDSMFLSSGLDQQLLALVKTKATELAAIGITSNSDGTLSVNQTTLDNAATNSPTAVEEAIGGTQGLATTLNGLSNTILTGLSKQFASQAPAELNTALLPTALARSFEDVLSAAQLFAGSLVNVRG